MLGFGFARGSLVMRFPSEPCKFLTNFQRAVHLQHLNIVFIEEYQSVVPGRYKDYLVEISSQSLGDMKPFYSHAFRMFSSPRKKIHSGMRSYELAAIHEIYKMVKP